MPPPLDSPLFTESLEIVTPLFENHLASADQSVGRGDEADRVVKSDDVVMHDVLC